MNAWEISKKRLLPVSEQALNAWKDQEIVSGTPDVAFYAQARTELARILSQLGKYEQAESHFRSVFDDNRRIYGAHTPFGRWHQTVIDSALDLACCLVRQNKLSEAEEVIVGEMPETFEGLDEMSRMFATIAQQCYQRALKDVHWGKSRHPIADLELLSPKVFRASTTRSESAHFFS